MTISEVKDILNAQIYACENKIVENIVSACGADLMSDVLAFSKEKGLLLTGLINPQVIRTAEMMDIKAVVFVRGKAPTQDIVELAKENEIVVLSTDFPMYIACGLLYSKGLGNIGGF